MSEKATKEALLLRLDVLADKVRGLQAIIDEQARRLAAAPGLDRDRLAEALHNIGGEFDSPFSADHPRAMHNSQAAAIAVEYTSLTAASADPRRSTPPHET